MIIYFEGLSCSGKTTLINKLHESFSESVIIPELPTDFYSHADLDDFCRHNDERKCSDAQKNRHKNLVFVDRAYPSTLAYNFIQYKLGISNEYFNTLMWYMDRRLRNIIFPPDLYVYLYADERLIIKRAKNLNRFAKTIAWYSDPEIGCQFYEHFFKLLEPNIPLLEINGSSPIENQIKLFTDFVNAKKT